MASDEEKIRQLEKSLGATQAEVQRLLTEKNTMMTKCEHLDVELRTALAKLTEREDRISDQHANNWWMQVWRECSREVEQEADCGQPKIVDCAVEVVKLRQEALLSSFRARLEKEELLDRLSYSENEIVRLNGILRNNRFAEQIKVAELEKVIGDFKSKSEIFSKYALARQELTDEKILTMQLQVDGESCHQALMSEQSKLKMAKKTVEDLESQLFREKVHLSLLGIENVSPRSIVASFAGRMIVLENELALSKAKIQELARSEGNHMLLSEDAFLEDFQAKFASTFENLTNDGKLFDEMRNCGEHVKQLRGHLLVQTLRNQVTKLSEELSQMNHKVASSQMSAGAEEKILINSLKDQLLLLERDSKSKSEENILLKKKIFEIEAVAAQLAVETDTQKLLPDPELSLIVTSTTKQDEKEELSITRAQNDLPDSTLLKQSSFEIKVLRESLRVLQEGMHLKENEPPTKSKNQSDAFIFSRKCGNFCKRIIELSSELSSATLEKLFVELQLTRAEERCEHFLQDLNQNHSELQKSNGELHKLRTCIVELKEKMKNLMQERYNEKAERNLTVDSIEQALRNAELKINSQNTLIQQLTAQLKLSPDIGNRPSLLPEFDTEDGMQIPKHLQGFVSLIEELQGLDLDADDTTLQVQRLKSKASSSLRDIFQSVVYMPQFQLSKYDRELHDKMTNDRFSICYERMKTYQRQAEAFLNILTERGRAVDAFQSEQISILRNALARAEDRYREISKNFIEEQVKRVVAENKCATQSGIIHQLELQGYEHSHPENSLLKSRDDMQGSMLQYIHEVERSMLDWRQRQLPSLISQHLCIENPDCVNFYVENATEDIRLTEAERSACLAHALSLTKSEMSETCMKSACIAETNETLKRKNIFLECRLAELSAKVGDELSVDIHRTQAVIESTSDSQGHVPSCASKVIEMDARIVAQEEELNKLRHEKRSLELQCKYLEEVVNEMNESERLLTEQYSKQAASMKLRHELALGAERRKSTKVHLLETSGGGE